MLKSKILLLFVLAACIFGACKSDPAYDEAAQLAIDDDIIVKQLAANGETATKTPEGIYYQIISKAATPVNPPVKIRDSLDNVFIHFVSRLYTTQVFIDSTASNTNTTDLDENTKFIMANAIRGWKIGLALIQPGDRIRLIVPSTLAYQNRIVGTVRGAVITNTPIPANSILDFDIKLIDVKPVPAPGTTTPTTITSP